MSLITNMNSVVFILIFLIMTFDSIKETIAKKYHQQHHDQQNKEYPIQLNPNRVVFAIDCGSHISTRSFQGFRYQPVK